MDTAPSQLVSCRLAEPNDAPLLARMSRDYVERGHGWSWQASRIKRCINQPECVVLCAVMRNSKQIAGFAIMDFSENRSHLSLLAVLPSMRRNGIAHALLTWLEKTAMVAGVEEITLEVRAQNLGARRFYKRLNYEEFAQVPRYYSGRETAYRFRKRLRATFDATSSNQQ